MGPWGWLQIRGARLLAEGGVRLLEDGALSVHIQGQDISIPHMSVRSGRGRIQGRGQVRLDGLLPAQASAEVEVKDLSVLAGTYMASVNTAAALQIERQGDDFHGQVTIDGGRVKLTAEEHTLQAIGELEDVVFTSDSAATANAAPGTLPVAAPGTAPEASPGDSSDTEAVLAGINLAIITGKPIVVTGEELDIALNTDLQLALKDGVLTSLSGDIKAAPNASVVILDQRYQVDRALVAFDGSATADPLLNIRVYRPFRPALVSIDVTGRASDPKVLLSSDDPAHTELDIISIMQGNDPNDESSTGRSVQQRITSGVTDGVIGAVANQINDLLVGVPVDVFRPHSGGFEVGKWVTDDLLLGYQYRAAPTSEQNSNEGIVEYRLWRNLLLEGRYGDDGNGDAEVLWIFRW